MYDGLMLTAGNLSLVTGFKAPLLQVRILPCAGRRIASGLEYVLSNDKLEKALLQISCKKQLLIQSAFRGRQ